VTNLTKPIPGFELEPLVGTDASVRLTASVSGCGSVDRRDSFGGSRAWSSALNGASSSIRSWCKTVTSSRPGRCATWTHLSGRERSSPRPSQSVEHVATLATREGLLLHQRRLDELVAQVAEKLMPASATNRQEVLDWSARFLLNSSTRTSHSFDVMTSFELTILESEWPPRDEIPDRTHWARSPLTRPDFYGAARSALTVSDRYEDITDDYRDRMIDGAGITPAGVAVPLLLGDSTWGCSLPSLQPAQLEHA